MKKIGIALMSFLVSAQAYAGAESHGGQVVVCPGKETVMLDYYQATLPTEADGTPDLVDVSKMSADDVLALFQSRLETSTTGQGLLWNNYSWALDLLGPTNTWLEGSLQSVADSDPAYALPPECTLQQVAIRQDSTMYIDPAVFHTLSPAQQAILRAHEALYYVASQLNGLDSSIEVRMVIRNLLLKNEDIVALSKTVHEMKSKLFWWEFFTEVNSNVYFSKDKLNEMQLNYFYTSDGSLINFGGRIANNSFGGLIACSSDDFGDCHTVTGDHECTLKNMFWFEITPSNTAITHFELICSDIGADVWLSTNPDLDPLIPVTPAPVVK
jgi:hypothetical protein